MPRIETTPTVRFVLVFLRFYLLVLLALITVKFVRTFSGSSPQPHTPPPVQRVQRAEDAGQHLGLARPYSGGSELRSESKISRVPWRSHHEAT